jgi:sigma-B regulation protein RsbU (phosphoserine phosphatase)
VSTEEAVRAAGRPPGRRRRGFRLRVHIATLFVALIVAAGLALVGYGYVATSRLLVSAAEQEVGRVAERTASEVQALLAPTHLLVGLMAQHRLTRASSLAERLESLPALTGALDRHAEISAVYVGFDNGDFFLVRPLHAARPHLEAPVDAVYLVQSRAARDAVPARFLFLDGQLGVLSDTPRPDYRFDPRAREWYQQALGTPSAIRTAPYVFFTTREVGTTLAQRGVDGRSVVGADTTLQALVRLLARSRLTPGTRLALVDRDGRVVARRPPGPPPSGPGEASLVRLTELGDPALAALLARASPPGHGVSLRVGAEEWVGVRHPIEPGVGDPLVLLVASPWAELVGEARSLAKQQLVIGLLVMGLALALVGLSARRISRPLEALTQSVGRIGQGDLESPLPRIDSPLEVATLGDVTDRMRLEIRDHIEARAAHLAAEHRRARELEIAQQIQRSMLPTLSSSPLQDRYAIAATLRPALEVAGDLYNFFARADHRLFLAIGDVADKGVPAALLMARVTGLLRALGQGSQGPDEVLRELDGRLSQGNDTCTFVTMACVELDGDTGAFRAARAGHDAPLLRRADGTVTVLPGEGGPALGLEAGGDFPVAAGHLAPGDALVFFTDGVTEASDATGTAFGLERLCEVVAAADEGPGALPGRVADAVERFAAGGGPRDDLALVVVELHRPDVAVSRASWRLTLSGEPGDVLRVQARVQAILRSRDVDPETIHASALILEEVGANIVNHAYRGRPDLQAHIELRLPPGHIETRFEDAGPPFNPLAAPDPDLEVELADRPVGGLGILLVKQLADDCEYARRGPLNVLTVRQRRPAGTVADAPPGREAPPAERGAMSLQVAIDSPAPAERRARLTGRLDTVTAPQLDAALGPVLGAAEITTLVFDLGGLEYISSAGVRSLVVARKALEGRGGRVVILNPQPTVQKVFDIVKALPRDHVFGSQAELDRYLDAMQRSVRGRP